MAFRRGNTEFNTILSKSAIIILLICFYSLTSLFLAGDPCPVKALNTTGGENCCFLPFEHEGLMKNDCISAQKGSKNFTCPLDRFHHNIGTCRKF